MFFKIKGDSDLFSAINQKNKKAAVPFNLDQKGFFLVEILLVVVILSVSLTLIVQSLFSNLRVMKYNREFSQALLLLENKMGEAMVSESLGSLFDNNFMKSKEEAYQYAVEEKVISDDKGSTLKKVKMDISWHSGKRNNVIALVTYFFVDKKK